MRYLNALLLKLVLVQLLKGLGPFGVHQKDLFYYSIEVLYFVYHLLRLERGGRRTIFYLLG